MPNMVYACFVIRNNCDINGVTVDEEDVEQKIAGDKEAQPVALPDRFYNFNSVEGVHVRNIITRVFKEYLPTA